MYEDGLALPESLNEYGRLSNMQAWLGKPMTARRRSTVVAVVLATLLAACATTAPRNVASDPDNISIPFASRGGIMNWQAIDESHLLVQDQHRSWYEVTLQNPSYRLPFVESLGFATDPSGALSRWASIVVEGMPYPIASITRAKAPSQSKHSR